MRTASFELKAVHCGENINLILKILDTPIQNWEPGVGYRKTWCFWNGIPVYDIWSDLGW